MFSKLRGRFRKSNPISQSFDSTKDGSSTLSPRTSMATTLVDSAAETAPFVEPFGMRVLYSAEKYKIDTNLDIIFIHGLTGNCESTWTSEDGYFWPKHMSLRTDYKISAYGYDIDISKLGGAEGPEYFRELARSLISAVLNFKKDNPHRPTIFVVHCLGGLLLQQALVLSQNEESNSVFFFRTAGIIFLGTPQSEEGIKAWDHIIPKLISHGEERPEPSIEGPNFSLAYLTSIPKLFQDILSDKGAHIRVYCFYETKEIEGIGLIVPKEAAILKDYRSAPIVFDHIKMTKFSGYHVGALSFIRDILLRWPEGLYPSFHYTKNWIEWSYSERSFIYGVLKENGDYSPPQFPPSEEVHDGIGQGGGCA